MFPISSTLINVPSDQPTIQAGINFADPGDTILVNPGTYTENLNFNGKNVVLGSLYLTTSDPSYIETTAIDGGGNGSVLTFENGEDESTHVNGFTITNGKVFNDMGAGVYCDSANPTFSNLIIRDNRSEAGSSCTRLPCSKGGGMYFNYSNSIINDVQIINNVAEAGDGGGIYANESNLFLSNVLFADNSSASGGGLWMNGSYADVANTTFEGNGGAIILKQSELELFNSILWNNFEEMRLLAAPDTSTITIFYSNVQGGLENIISGETSTVNWLGENMDEDPIFCNPERNNYYLYNTSPCVGTGAGGTDMGVFGLGCGSPSDFSLIAPSDSETVYIDESNMNEGYITFSWEESFDEDEDSLFYLFRAASTEMGDHRLDTNVTSFDLSYLDILDDLVSNYVNTATIEWTIFVSDSIDTVEAVNAPFTLIVDGSEALKVLAEVLVPEVFALHQNYPNPFNPITTIRYDLPENSFVNINIYDLLGRQVKTLVNQTQNAGFKSVQWNATNDNGKPVSAGVYLYQILAAEFVQTRKMVLLK